MGIPVTWTRKPIRDRLDALGLLFLSRLVVPLASLGFILTPAAAQIIQQTDPAAQITAIDQQIYSLQLYLEQLRRDYRDARDEARDMEDRLNQLTPRLKQMRKDGQAVVKQHQAAEKRFNAAKANAKKTDTQFRVLHKRLMGAIDTSPAWLEVTREFKEARAEYLAVRNEILKPLKQSEEFRRAQDEVDAAQRHFDEIEDSRDATRQTKTAAANDLLQLQGVTTRMEQRALGMEPAFGKAQLTLSLAVLDSIAVRGELVMAVYADPRYVKASRDRAEARMEWTQAEEAYKTATSEREQIEGDYKRLSADANRATKDMAAAEGRRDRIDDEMDRVNRELAYLRARRESLSRTLYTYPRY